jgi:tetratricopeptide (TPR) repeat protein
MAIKPIVGSEANQRDDGMRAIRAVRLLVAAAILISPLGRAKAQTDPDLPVLQQAAEAYDHGDTARALTLVEAVLEKSPDNPTALYFSAQINFRMGNNDVARGRLERLVALSGNYFAAWELMVQVTQEQGDLPRRDEAIARLKISITSALDPDIRSKVDFIRDRIPVGNKAILAADYFERGGSDFTRYQFALGDPRNDPDHGLMLRTDAATTETWADTALLPPDKQLFHLDLVDPTPDGKNRTAIYQYYVGEPDYDTVRGDVMKILRGEAKPLSGEPGSLSGILNR